MKIKSRKMKKENGLRQVYIKVMKNIKQTGQNKKIYIPVNLICPIASTKML